MTGTYTDSIRARRNDVRIRVMERHRLADGSHPVMILVRERTGRVGYSDEAVARGPHLEQWIITYNTGETRSYERFEPILG